MSVRPRFTQTSHTVPPGGAWFFQLGDDRVFNPVYDIALRQVAAILKKYNDPRPADQALAEFMCPHMPAWFCAGPVQHSPVIYGKDAAAAAPTYLARKLVPADMITRRMEACQMCPKHRRDFCLHCTGWDAQIREWFGFKRPELPVDDASGCCSCARTFEMVIASVEYGKDDPVWEGAPETCWRRMEK